VDAQLDFLVSELQGPESRAAQSIFATQDVPSAAAAIARDFLRPAPENLQKRVAQYTGGTAMQPQGLLGTVSTQGQEPEKLPFFQRPETANLLDTLAIGFSGMTLNPNQALIQSAQERIKGRGQAAQTAQQRNATIDWLRNSGLPNADMLIGAVESNAMSPGQAASTAFQILRTNQAAAADPSVQSSSPLPDLTGTVITMRDGSVRVVTAGGETLTGQAALDFVRESQAKYTEDQRSIYGARRGGALEAEVDFGGAAEAARKGGGLTVERGFEAYDQAAKASAGISTINEAIAALDGGAKAGIIYNMLPNVTEASASLRNAMDRMGLDVISSVTFGALSEAEMNLAMETAVPRNLDAAQLRVWLERKRDAQQKAQEALIAAARYLTQPGNTISGWMDQQQSQRGSAPAQSGAAQPPAGLSPEDMKWLED
jgi:hypothetical protein